MVWKKWTFGHFLTFLNVFLKYVTLKNTKSEYKNYNIYIRRSKNILKEISVNFKQKNYILSEFIH